MQTRILRASDLPEEGSDSAGPPPDFILAFLPPAEDLDRRLSAISERWPDALLFGCEAVTQFAGDTLSGEGILHLFCLDDPSRRPEVVAVQASHADPFPDEDIDRIIGTLRSSSGALVICDGLRFPANRLLALIREKLGTDAPLLAGGLASQSEPIDRPGARTFLGEQIYESAALVVCFAGVTSEIAIVRGWKPASPIFEISRAEENVVFEIDGKPATEWYRQFFEVDGEIAPMPMSAHRFPLIIEGPKPERVGLYRSMKFFDEPPGAVSYWGEIEEGDLVRLGMGDGGSLIEEAGRLPAAGDAEAAILFSCVGREMVLGEVAAGELEAMNAALGVPLSGFFSFAEIGPSSKGVVAYYNQTAVLVLLKESGA